MLRSTLFAATAAVVLLGVTACDPVEITTPPAASSASAAALPSASASAAPVSPSASPSPSPSQSPSPAPSATAAPTKKSYALPPVDAKVDYQIGAAYTPPAGVKVVSRDREAEPAAGLYTICYVNAFQAQPGEASWWKSNHDDLLLKQANGDYVVDGDWDEILLDISTAAKRTAVATIVNGWIDGCATAGFQAVEPDNIDSYDRSEGLLEMADAVAFLKLLAPHAHAAGLAIAQKNTAELGVRGRDAGLDFAVTEECGRYDECGDYADVYGDHIVDIEYRDNAFTKACAAVGDSVSVVRRDVGVTAPGSKTYVYKAC